MNLMCAMCVGETIQAEAKAALGEDVEIPDFSEAITLAPSWQQQRIGPQLVMACVAIPVCKKHLSVQELSPAEQAIRNGRLLQGHQGG